MGFIRYILLLFFNAAAFYSLFTFVFGGGGVIDSTHKMIEIENLRRRKIEIVQEVSSMRQELIRMRMSGAPTVSDAVRRGSKAPDTILFQFNEKEDKKAFVPEEVSVLTLGRVYMCSGLAAILLLAGNLLLLLKLDKRRGV